MKLIGSFDSITGKRKLQKLPNNATNLPVYRVALTEIHRDKCTV